MGAGSFGELQQEEGEEREGTYSTKEEGRWERYLRERASLDYGPFTNAISLDERRALQQATISAFVRLPRVSDEQEPELSMDHILRELNRQAMSERRGEIEYGTAHWVGEVIKKRHRQWDPGIDPQRPVANVNTLYKRKADKVRPVDDPMPREELDFGYPDWKIRAWKRVEESNYGGNEVVPEDKYFARRFAQFPRGERLTDARFDAMDIGTELTPEEREFFRKMLIQREGVLAWEFSESGRIHHDVCPPYKIRTIPHKAWQVPTFNLPMKLRAEAYNMIIERIHRNVLELTDSQYRNPWFLVAKKDTGHRLINNAQKMNRVTIRDANLPPSADEFSEQFAGCQIMSLIDLFSGYDQIELDAGSRDMTAFHTPAGLVRYCTMVMGATNSVAAFIRVVQKILEDHYYRRCQAFIDDILVKGPTKQYEGRESEVPGVRQFVFEHISALAKVLLDMELSGAHISGGKSNWMVQRVEVVGYECDGEGRHPQYKKVRKILEWPECRDVKEVRMFIGICVYYRQWVFCFAIKAEPLFLLLRKDAQWIWQKEQKMAMLELKKAITEAPALVQIDYTEPLKGIYVGCDASKDGGGAVLEQEDESGKRHPVRFESTLWGRTERDYHAGKLECKAVLFALKKFQKYLYGVFFTIETDAKTLIAQLNRASADLPGSLMNRWIATILMHDFEIKHVEGKKNVVADALSRYPKPDGWVAPEDPEEDLDVFVNARIGATAISPTLVRVSWVRINAASTAESDQSLELAEIETVEPEADDQTDPLEGSYSEESQAIARFLLYGTYPRHVERGRVRRWKQNALRHFVRDRLLFRKRSKNVLQRRVVDDPEIQQAAIAEVHEELGHRGIQSVHGLLSERYWWPGMNAAVQRWISKCEECQLATKRRQQEAMENTFAAVIWEQVFVDVVKMPRNQGKEMMVLGREALTGWVEGRALARATSEAVAKFVFEDFICRWGCMQRLSVDGGPENKAVLHALTTLYNVRRVVPSPHNPQAMGFIERGHQPIINALARTPGSWVENLPVALMADRMTAKRPTGYSPFRLVVGQNPLLPIDLKIPTWQTLPWDRVRTDAELLAMRMKQLDLREEDMEDAAARMRRLRRENKDYWDSTKDLRPDGALKVGDLVLLFDTILSKNMAKERKLDARWLGPYRIAETYTNRNSYRLADLNGVIFPHTTAANKLRLFIVRGEEEIQQRDRGMQKILQQLHEAPDEESRQERDEEAFEESDNERLRRMPHRDPVVEIHEERRRAPSPQVRIPVRWEKQAQRNRNPDDYDQPNSSSIAGEQQGALRRAACVVRQTRVSASQVNHFVVAREPQYSPPCSQVDEYDDETLSDTPVLIANDISRKHRNRMLRKARNEKAKRASIRLQNARNTSC